MYIASVPIGLAAYAYVAYPAILWLLARVTPRRKSEVERPLPLVTLVIPAFNEATQIRGAIEALLAQEYPRDRRQILVLSDASTDDTDAIVAEYADRGVELLRMRVRCGKTAAENASITAIRGDVVVNTDASIRLHPTATRHLIEAMADPSVGVASTQDVSVAGPGSSHTHAEKSYVGYEMWVRQLETRMGGIIGASGSGYAIRAGLHRIPVPEDLSRDFSAALTAHRHGLRAVSVPNAFAYVPRTQQYPHEYRRKVRTISRGIGTLFFNRDLLNPLKHGLFAWKLLSHKLCRWLVPLAAVPALLAVWVAALWLWPGTALLGGIAVAVLVGAWLAPATHGRMPLSMLAGPILANAAVVHAWWRFARRHHDHIWEPTRRSPVMDP
jgi:cellulose synthase/poly-beta-1,6-N-acetylglucosamine synthase-like glycosyltransferase